MAEIAKNFGKQIKVMRRERSLSQAQLADLTGVSEEWVRRIERGDGSPSLDTIEGLAHALGTTTATLFGAHPDAPLLPPALVRVLGTLSEDELAWVEAAARLVSKRPQ